MPLLNNAADVRLGSTAVDRLYLGAAQVWSRVPAYPAAVLADSPAGYWRLGETTGTTAADASGNNRPLTYYGSPTLGAAGALAGSTDKAVAFNGVDQYAQSPAALTAFKAQDFTIEFWAKPGTQDASIVTLVDYEHGAGNWAVQSENSGASFYLAYHTGSGFTIPGSINLTAGVWQHVAIVKSGATVTYYRNGTQVAQATGSSANVSYTASPSLALARWIASAGREWAGMLDEVAIYPTALSADRIAAHYAAATTAGPNPLAGVNIGDAFMGGYYAGIIDTTRPGSIVAADASQTGQRYALIVAPKSLEVSRAYKTANTAGPSASRTRWDGLAATTAMASTNYPAANYCHGLAYPADAASRWYLPAMDELELLYRNFKPQANNNTPGSASSDMFPGGTVAYGANPSSDPTGAAYTTTNPTQTPVTAFRNGSTESFALDGYWSATEQSATTAWRQSFGGAMEQGNQTFSSKTLTSRVRPVRRLVL